MERENGVEPAHPATTSSGPHPAEGKDVEMENGLEPGLPGTAFLSPHEDIPSVMTFDDALQTIPDGASLIPADLSGFAAHSVPLSLVAVVGEDGSLYLQLQCSADGTPELPVASTSYSAEAVTIAEMGELQNFGLGDVALPETSAPDLSHRIQGESDMLTDTRKDEGKTLSRKRLRKPEQWQMNKRKTCRQAGQQYIRADGKVAEARKVGPHKLRCKFSCMSKFSLSDRTAILSDFWSLSDNEKQHYCARTTEKMEKARTRIRVSAKRRQKTKHHKFFTFKYYLFQSACKERVCKFFYLKTLDISQKQIMTYYLTRNQQTGTPRPSKQGKHTKKRISETHRQAVRDHIGSFPRVESHYCRARTQKEYLEPGLSVARMYELFCEKRASECECDADYIEPVKHSLYTEIFNTEFNIAFHEPKSDRCDTCEAYRASSEANTEGTDMYNTHIASKTATKEERDYDRQIRDTSHAIVSFDLQNVIPLPRANISSFFYRRKLNMYNLTSHCSVGSKREGYCAVWHEGMSGRSGNDIASCVVQTMEKILQRHPSVTKFSLWSDSCIPQNKNSVMSCAVASFLEKNTGVVSVTQKFAEPGHSAVQKVDNLHSQIECRLKISEVYSPVGVVRLLTQVNKKSALIVMQMRQFYDYQSVAKSLNFCEVPYSKVKVIKYFNNPPTVCMQYGVSFAKEQVTNEVTVQQMTGRKLRKTASKESENTRAAVLFTPKQQRPKKGLNDDKVKDLKVMLKYMPQVDLAFYETILPSPK